MSTPSLPNKRFRSLGLLLVTPLFIGCAYEASVLESGWPTPKKPISELQMVSSMKRSMATGYAVIDTQKGQSHPQRADGN